MKRWVTGSRPSESSQTVQKKTMKCILIAMDSWKDLRVPGTRAPLR
jgi:hypothetical protein